MHHVCNALHIYCGAWFFHRITRLKCPNWYSFDDIPQFANPGVWVLRKNTKSFSFKLFLKERQVAELWNGRPKHHHLSKVSVWRIENIVASIWFENGFVWSVFGLFLQAVLSPFPSLSRQFASRTNNVRAHTSEAICAQWRQLFILAFFSSSLGCPKPWRPEPLPSVT